MLLKQTKKILQEKPDKGRNNDRWIKQRKNNNYLPKAKKKNLQTKYGEKQFKTVVIGKISLWYWRNFT